MDLNADLINSYDGTDVRFNATIDTSYTTNDNPPQHGNIPFYDKFIDPSAASMITSHFDWPDNFPILRYADVMMMYAQILNDQNAAPPPEAVDILNRIRARAGLDPVSRPRKQIFKKR